MSRRNATKVLMVVPSAHRAGGGDVWLEGLLRHAGKASADITVVFEEDGELRDHAGLHGCRTAALPHDGTGRFPAERLDPLVAPLAEIMRDVRPEVSVFWSPRAQLYGSAAHAAAGGPGRTAWVQHVMPSRFWLHERAALAPADVVVCVSGAVARRHRGLYPHREVCVVHPGVARPIPATGAGVGERLAITDAAPVIGVVGRIEPWKGQDTAVRMLARIGNPGARLLLVGEAASEAWPEFAGQVEQLARAEGVAQRVIFAGHCEEVAPLLSQMDVLVCASREEGFGLAVLEAMAAGIPVVATRCGGPEDIIEHELNGLLVPVDDERELAAAVERVLAGPGLARSLAAAARRTWSERFTDEISADAFFGFAARLACR